MLFNKKRYATKNFLQNVKHNFPNTIPKTLLFLIYLCARSVNHPLPRRHIKEQLGNAREKTEKKIKKW